MRCVGSIWNILGVLAELRKGTVSFVMCVRLSVCLSFRMEQLNYHWMDFYGIRCLMVLRKSVQKIEVSLKPDTNNGYMKTDERF